MSAEPPRIPPTTAVALGQAMNLGLHLVSGVVVGGLMGYGLDWLLGTLPLFLLIFLFLGFAAGLRQIWRQLQGPPAAS